VDLDYSDVEEGLMVAAAVAVGEAAVAAGAAAVEAVAVEVLMFA
jgi:hypothetical protein